MYSAFPDVISVYKEDTGKTDDLGIAITNDYSYGKVMNIMMNCDYLEKLFDNTDDNNNIFIFEVLKTICRDINRGN